MQFPRLEELVTLSTLETCIEYGLENFLDWENVKKLDYYHYLESDKDNKFRADAPDEMQKTATVIIIFHRVAVECLCTVSSMRRSLPEDADLTTTPILEDLGVL
ncbi:hypothetical protein V502_08884 [Pseudogymnoascus sp. VKM F-4520 (FW-2644)]|nr:hypothetical protein V502_08884 [Pseudogymnoascus sp. VKM F-4520 (FW-2644)]